MSTSKHIFKFYKSNNTKIVIQAEGIEVNKTYQINSGFYKNKILMVEWISFDKKVFVDGKHYRQIHGTIMSIKSKFDKEIQYNTISIHLNNKFINNDSSLSKLSNIIIVKAVKTGNRKAIQEFVRRFKKMPKINK